LQSKAPFISTLAVEKSSLNKGEAFKEINKLKNLDTKGADVTVDGPKMWTVGDSKATG
jgi:hypothetical protein